MFIFLSLLITLMPAHADSKFLCSAWTGRDFYQDLKSLEISDKTKHCALSCYLALRCGSFESFHLGLIKEILDFFGQGQAEWADLQANKQGITLALTRRARNQKECLIECSQIYE